ncbi:hypothetical protein [Paenibacillus silviterrae]|jgi:hypothetical protein|uniref:hypothetical protein n=1 Tax=Paenibacillus silviterrae TaxID=3242194 RepID=UPI0025438E00|nr:hypothetical protein [Paenibacillus chinjuensis]
MQIFEAKEEWLDEPLTKVGIALKLWNIKARDPEDFKRRVLAYLAIGYTGWVVVRLDKPFVLCKDTREKKGKRTR